MNTIVYLIRHSEKFDPDNIAIYNTTDSKQLKTEKKMLSVEGEKRAEILSKETEFEDVDVLYSKEKPTEYKGKIGSISYVPSVAGLLITSYVINKFLEK